MSEPDVAATLTPEQLREKWADTFSDPKIFEQGDPALTYKPAGGVTSILKAPPLPPQSPPNSPPPTPERDEELPGTLFVNSCDTVSKQEPAPKLDNIEASRAAYEPTIVGASAPRPTATATGSASPAPAAKPGGTSGEAVRTGPSASKAPTGSVGPLPPGTATDSTRALAAQAKKSGYTLRKKLGEGGMGVVWIAEQNSLRREVAVKQIKGVANEDSNNQFVSEALVTGYLDHPNIVPIHSLEEGPEGQLFIAMKLVRGMPWKVLLHPQYCETDEERVRSAKMDMDAHIRILLSVCNAVAFAHSRNFIHRDLKPENVMVGEYGEVLVMDWGIAVEVTETPSEQPRTLHRSEVTYMCGTPAYMAPEMADGDGARFGPWTDVYLLGAILFEIIAKHPPHRGKTVREALMSASQGNPPSFAPEVPEELQKICRRALAKDHRDRYLSVADFQYAIELYFKHRESTIVASQGEQSPDLAKKVVLFEQALNLWPANPAARMGFDRATLELAKQEKTARFNRRAVRGLVAAVLLGVTVAAIWIAAEQRATEKQRIAAVESEKIAVVSTAKAQAQLIEANHEAGRAWLERSQLMSQHHDHFAAAMMAAKAVGFEGFGRSTADDAHPRLLKPDSVEFREAVMRAKEIRDRCIWQSPRQPEPITAVAFSPDGTLMATACGGPKPEACVISIWDVSTGTVKSTLSGHTAMVTSIDFSPDGTLIASASGNTNNTLDATVRLWDIATGTLRATFGGHAERVNNVAFSPDGKTLASASTDKTVRLWDIASGLEKAALNGHTDRVSCVAYSPDGETLASAGYDRVVRVWDLATRKEVATLRGHLDIITSVAFSPDGTLIASGSGSSAGEDNSVRLWDRATGRERSILRGHKDTVRAVAFSPDGSTLATASTDATVRLWNVGSGREQSILNGHTGSVSGVAFSPDGAILLSGSRDTTARLWETAGGKERATLNGHKASVTSVAFSPDGSQIASSSNDATVRLWNAATGKEKALLAGHKEKVTSAVFSPDGKTLASASDDMTVRLWDVETGKEKAVLSGHTKLLTEIVFSPDGSLLASASSDQTARLWDVATGKQKAVLQHEKNVRALAFSPDGKTLASGGADRLVHLWNTQTGVEKATLKGHSDIIWAVAFNPDGSLLASASAGGDQNVRLWDAKSGAEKGILKGHTNSVTALAFGPDGTLASAGWDQTVILWNAATGKAKAVLAGHTGRVTNLAFSNDGAMLASAGWDRTVRLWSSADGSERGVLNGHIDSINSVAFSPDGSLASASGDQTVRLWETTMATTPAPDVCEITGKGAADVWALERSVLPMLTAYLPHCNVERNGVTFKIAAGGVPYLSLNPYSIVGILCSSRSQAQKDFLLFQRYLSKDNWNSALLILRRLPKGEGQDGAEKAYAERLAAATRCIAAAADADARRAGEAGNWTERLAVLRRWAMQDPSSADAAYRLAQELLVTTEASLRDPPSALRYAEIADRLTKHEDPAILATYALALYRTGQTEKAVATQQKAIARLPASTPADQRAAFENALKQFQGGR